MPKHSRLCHDRSVLTSRDRIAAGLALGGCIGANVAAIQQHPLLAAMLAVLTLLVFLIWGAFLLLDRAV